MESKYLSQFKKLKEVGPDVYCLRGDRIVVEVLPKEEVKLGNTGLVVASDMRQVRGETVAQGMPTLAIVLACGEGFIDDDGNNVDLEYKPGAVVLVSELGLKKYSVFPGLNNYSTESIALTRESEVHMYWPTIEAYEAYRALLNS